MSVWRLGIKLGEKLPVFLDFSFEPVLLLRKRAPKICNILEDVCEAGVRLLMVKQVPGLVRVCQVFHGLQNPLGGGAGGAVTGVLKDRSCSREITVVEEQRRLLDGLVA